MIKNQNQNKMTEMKNQTNPVRCFWSQLAHCDLKQLNVIYRSHLFTPSLLWEPQIFLGI